MCLALQWQNLSSIFSGGRCRRPENGLTCQGSKCPCFVSFGGRERGCGKGVGQRGLGDGGGAIGRGNGSG